MAKWKLAVAVLALCSVTLGGCRGKWTGGGSVDGASGNGKATFGFNYICENGQNNGHVQYVDHSPGPLSGGSTPKEVRFHAQYFFDELTCEGPADQQQPPPVLLAFGTYEPQPKKLGPGGVFILFLVDGGEPGAGDDVFDITLEGGIYDGYMNGGSLAHGNVQHHP